MQSNRVDHTLQQQKATELHVVALCRVRDDAKVNVRKDCYRRGVVYDTGYLGVMHPVVGGSLGVDQSNCMTIVAVTVP